MSDDPSDYSVLTLGHFLIGTSLTAIPEPTMLNLNFNRLKKYQRLQYLIQSFWKRWSIEYISEMQQCYKWYTKSENIQPGLLVIIKDENLPPMKWIMGRIIDVHPGTDGLIRVATIRTASSILKRAISRLSVLPIDTTN